MPVLLGTCSYSAHSRPNTELLVIPGLLITVAKLDRRLFHCLSCFLNICRQIPDNGTGHADFYFYFSLRFFSFQLLFLSQVTSGTRFALTIAFTCNPKHAISDPNGTGPATKPAVPDVEV